MTLWKNLFIAAYLVIQIALPARGFLIDKFESRGNFTWNMYSAVTLCRVQYRLDTPDGQTRWVRHREYFKRPALYQRVLFADVLPEFNRWLCDEYRRKGELGSLRGYVICALNFGPEVELLDHQVDLCTAPNYGVKTQRSAP